MMSRFLVFLFGAYKKLVSPVLVSLFGSACRFTPTCSEYTIEALKKHGALKGLGLGARRILKCHPWGSSGYDPVNN